MRGRAIRALRRSRGWTQVELAARMGTDAVTVSRWERGVSSPRPSAQTRLQELAALVPRDLAALARSIGVSNAERLLRRAALLAQPPARRRFAADATARLREVERARQEQLALRARARLQP
ncbi:MAG TPA: helix-turn-helix transcriptional regulator [Actinomycetota bacterium]